MEVDSIRIHGTQYRLIHTLDMNIILNEFHSRIPPLSLSSFISSHIMSSQPAETNTVISAAQHHKADCTHYDSDERFKVR